MILVAGCENVQRSLVFTTGTQLGLSLSVKPESDAPIEMVLGYKRAEVLFDPIMEDIPGGNPEAGREYTIKDEPHSVMAKLLGDIKATGNTGAPNAEGAVTVAQWFASGEAAEILARNGGVVALTNQPGQVAEALGAAGFSQSTPVSVVAPLALATYSALSKLASLGDAESARLRDGMDAAAAQLLTADRLAANRVFTFNNSVLTEEQSVAINPPFKVDQLAGYYNRLDRSVKALGEAKKLAGPPITLKLDRFNAPAPAVNNNPPTATSQETTQVADLEKQYSAMFKAMDREFRVHPAVVDAVNYLVKSLRDDSK